MNRLPSPLLKYLQSVSAAEARTKKHARLGRVKFKYIPTTYANIIVTSSFRSSYQRTTQENSLPLATSHRLWKKIGITFLVLAGSMGFLLQLLRTGGNHQTALTSYMLPLLDLSDDTREAGRVLLQGLLIGY